MEPRVGQQPAAVDGHDHGEARLLYDAEDRGRRRLG